MKGCCLWLDDYGQQHIEKAGLLHWSAAAPFSSYELINRD